MSDAIEVTDLFCLYAVPGGATVAALRGMSLHVPPGQRVVVHGPNGSGKTTLLRVLTGEVAASSGSVRVDGLELAGAGAARIAALRRAVLGLVDQHSGRSLRAELGVIDNIALQLRLAGRPKAEARALAEETLGELGLQALAGRRPVTLSAGEAQRVAVCAAVAHGPTVLLADEPTGELDVDSADAVYDLLAAAAKRADATLLLVTHDRRAARIADNVVRIRDGRLSEQWHPDTPHDEELVVDDRGWVRLPEELRRRTGLFGRARVREHRGELVLGVDVPTTPAAFQRPSLPAPLTPGADPVAELRDVHVRFGERVLFEGFGVAVRPARLTVVRGRSGAGKSTLLRLLLGLTDPDSGEVLLGGRPLAGVVAQRPGRCAPRSGRGQRAVGRAGRTAQHVGEPRAGAHGPRAARRHRSGRGGGRRARARRGVAPARPAAVRRRAAARGDRPVADRATSAGRAGRAHVPAGRGPCRAADRGARGRGRGPARRSSARPTTRCSPTPPTRRSSWPDPTLTPPWL